MPTMRNSKKVTVWGVVVLCLGAFVLYLAAVAQGPDRNLTLVRDVPSRAPVGVLAERVTDLKQWPSWFHYLDEAHALPDAKAPLQAGTDLKLRIDSHKTPWSGFELIARVEEYVPGSRFRLRVLEDSSQKLTRLFENIEWAVEIQPAGTGSRVLGTATARTRNWRSRIFGALVEKILMHQIFYPDLIKLAEFTQRDANSPGLPAGSSPDRPSSIPPTTPSH